jgi:aminocarboxymuconate-semialdehyde decarboxylase
MKIIDSHFHWWPRAVFEQLVGRAGFPTAQRNSKGGYDYWREPGEPLFELDSEWFELDAQLAHMDRLGHDVSVICSIGPFSLHFSELPPEEGRVAATLWNEEMAAAQKRYPGRLWASAAVPLVDTAIALEVLNHAVTDLGLVGVNVPGSIGTDPHIDAQRLEPFYARVSELQVPIFLHPTDAIFMEMLDGYNGALHLSLGRVMEVSVAAMRLIYSGLMARYPELKIFMSHTGGALPYQAGRMDKNGKRAGLPLPPSAYIKRMYVDTVSPHMLGIKFATEFYGVDHVIYGSDYPCWLPAEALRYFNAVGLSGEDQHKILYGNAVRVFNLKDQAEAPSRSAAISNDDRASPRRTVAG